MERMYYTIEEMHKLVNEFKRAGGSLFANAENKKDLMEKVQFHSKIDESTTNWCSRSHIQTSNFKTAKLQ
jgi:hypothetical protein